MFFFLKTPPPPLNTLAFRLMLWGKYSIKIWEYLTIRKIEKSIFPLLWLYTTIEIYQNGYFGYSMDSTMYRRLVLSPLLLLPLLLLLLSKQTNAGKTNKTIDFLCTFRLEPIFCVILYDFDHGLFGLAY